MFVHKYPDNSFEKQKENLEKARQNKTHFENAATRAKKEGRPYTSPTKGISRKGHLHSNETKEKLRNIALNSKHRRLVKSTREYVQKNGKIVLLDSYWEELLAKRLDSQSIQWERPSSPIQWKDKNGLIHNYFPDFYLPDFDIYLDPKNYHAEQSQKEKVEYIEKCFKSISILRTAEECKNFSIYNKCPD